ncbi:MAG TPA: hypothetical protein DCY13_17470, partial [Verrucomicrobiales bacterium]|nr:hypothetical protein [Verrucomicrobiales bacterium]
SAKAAAFFASLPPSAQREFTGWISAAKQEPTRQRRLATTIEMLERGERRNEKYRN